MSKEMKMSDAFLQLPLNDEKTMARLHHSWGVPKGKVKAIVLAVNSYDQNQETITKQAERIDRLNEIIRSIIETAQDFCDSNYEHEMNSEIKQLLAKEGE